VNPPLRQQSVVTLFSLKVTHDTKDSGGALLSRSLHVGLQVPIHIDIAGKSRQNIKELLIRSQPTSASLRSIFVAGNGAAAAIT
jgi:hypothetical protein